jgi:hypothetical protein
VHPVGGKLCEFTFLLLSVAAPCVLLKLFACHEYIAGAEFFINIACSLELG